MSKRDPKAPVNNETLDEAIEAFMEGMNTLLKEVKMTIRRELAPIKTDIRDVHRRMIDHEVDTPTRKEFDDLKSSVDKYHPL